MREYASFEVWGKGAPNGPLIVGEIAGQKVTDKIVVWSEYLLEMGKKGWRLASCSVFPDLRDQTPAGWLRFYAIFERPLPPSNRHNV